MSILPTAEGTVVRANGVVYVRTSNDCWSAPNKWGSYEDDEIAAMDWQLYVPVPAECEPDDHEWVNCCSICRFEAHEFFNRPNA